MIEIVAIAIITSCRFIDSELGYTPGLAEDFEIAIHGTFTDITQNLSGFLINPVSRWVTGSVGKDV